MVDINSAKGSPPDDDTFQFTEYIHDLHFLTTLII
jgi:hypothetical protein